MYQSKELFIYFIVIHIVPIEAIFPMHQWVSFAPSRSLSLISCYVKSNAIAMHTKSVQNHLLSLSIFIPFQPIAPETPSQRVQ
jgi:hypothetical protein